MSKFELSRQLMPNALGPLAMSKFELSRQQMPKALGPLARSVRHILAALG